MKSGHMFGFYWVLGDLALAIGVVGLAASVWRGFVSRRPGESDAHDGDWPRPRPAIGDAGGADGRTAWTTGQVQTRADLAALRAALGKKFLWRSFRG